MASVQHHESSSPFSEAVPVFYDEGTVRSIPSGIEENPYDADRSDRDVELRREGLSLFEPLSFAGSLSSTTATRCLFETFAEDVSALTISHLSLDDIASVSQVSKCLYTASRSNTLWKLLFDYRWNVSGSKDRDKVTRTVHEYCHYFTEYRLAHAHPHDLWITHWNCLFPCDGLAPGRCCIREGEARDAKDILINPGGTGVAASRQAFSRAATFHRHLSLTQFQPGQAHFLTDLLFFNLIDPATAHGQWELQELLVEVGSHHNQTQPEAGNPSDAPLYETAQHSWHVIQLTNPDFSRPVVFQISIQRPDCFAIHPSEGFIPPGETIAVTVGVRPLGTALAYAFESLNVQRDGLDAAWADLYTDEAHLPLAPFVVRYQYASVPPCSTDGIHHPRQRPSFRDTSHSSEQQLLLDYHLTQHVPAHQVRSIYLSAHVHAHNSWEEFARATCHVWDPECDAGPVYGASRARIGLSAALPRESSVDRDELTRAYRFHCEEMEWYRRQRRAIMLNIARCLRLVGREGGLPVDSKRLGELLCTIHGILQCYKAAPWSSARQKRVLVQLETLLDDMCTKIMAVDGDSVMPWRIAGVYRYTLSTASVFSSQSLQEDSIDASWKDEPEYMDAFRYLAHGPGRYCLGPQEDPNHLTEPVVSSSRRYTRRQVGCVTDAFMDDPISTLQAGICMIRDPRCLLVHGIYDRIPYPGTTVRRKRIIGPWLSTVSRSDAASLLALPKRVDDSATVEQARQQTETPMPRAAPRPNVRGPRLFQLLWMLGAQLGLAVVDRPDSSSVFVTRTILIASQWVNISLMAVPLFCTLVARYFEWIPSEPIYYGLEDFPYGLSSKMRFLTARECGYVANLLLFFWLALGRWTERYTSRDFFRIMLEHVTPIDRGRERMSLVWRVLEGIPLWLQRRWDAVCPLFLQRRLFTPHWNRRSRDELLKHISFWRSRDLVVKRSLARATAARCVFAGLSAGDRIDVGNDSSIRKVVVGSAVAVCSFSSCSPHFWLNLVTVFSCSIGLGMSVSLHSMERGRSTIIFGTNDNNYGTTGPMLKELSLVTVAILAFLIGQLVGSSGGVLFLAEFVVTMMSLILGGAGAISASAVESWFCFFCLSNTAFLGYLSGRVALLDGIRHKRVGYSSVLVSRLVAFLCCFWILVFAVCTWDSPVSLVIVRPLHRTSVFDWNARSKASSVDLKHLLQ